MKVTCTSDLHGSFPKTSGGDLLIIAGDLTGRDEWGEYSHFFFDWIGRQNYKKKIFIAGNHDMNLKRFMEENDAVANETLEYLEDSGTEFEGFKIWGSPWTLYFDGCNPLCTAFMLPTEEELYRKWDLIPKDTDILITHCPPQGILDQTDRKYRVGSSTLRNRLYGEEIKTKIHIFGHIHEGYGQTKKIMDFPHTQFVNASHMNKNYKNTNSPIDIEIGIFESD